MKKISVVVFLLVASVGGFACGSDSDCSLPAGNWSTANSGSLCQVNFFVDGEYAVYCGENEQGGYDCACGAVSEDPLEFTSSDFCDLEGEARACAAISACDFPI